MAPEGLGNRDQEGLVQMAMGLHGSGQGQGEAGFPDPDQGFNPGNGCPVDGDGQIDEAVSIGGQATATARGEEGQGPANVQRLGRGQGVLAGLEIHCPPGPWHGEPRFRIRAGQARDDASDHRCRLTVQCMHDNDHEHSMKWHKTVKNLHGITPWCIHLTFC